MTGHDHALPADCFLAYYVHHEARYAAVPGVPQSEPHPMVAAQSTGGGCAWEFKVSEHDIAGTTVKVSVFADAFEAFVQIPGFFAALVEQKPSTLAEVRALLDSLGARDVTARTRGVPVTARATVLVDLANRSAQVVGTDGSWQGTWSGVSRSTAAERISVDGWRFADDRGWRMTPDGGTREVVR